MRIAIVGMGAVGTAIAYRLTLHGGHEVTAVARNKRLEQLSRDDGHVTDASAPMQPVKLARVLPRLPVNQVFDLIMVTVLDHQVDDALLATLRASKAAKIMFMFNTVRPLAMYENAVGAERFEFGFPVIQARIDASGVLTHSIIRAGGWPVTSAALMNELRKVGLPVRVEKRMQSWQRAHAAFAAPFLGLAYRAKHVNGGKVAWADARDFARALDEGFRFFRALGEDTVPWPVALLGRSTVATTALFWLLGKTSVIVDAATYGTVESRALIDAMVELAGGDRGKLPALLAMRPSG